MLNLLKTKNGDATASQTAQDSTEASVPSNVSEGSDLKNQSDSTEMLNNTSNSDGPEKQDVRFTLQGSSSLNRVLSVGETKKAVISMLDKLPDSLESTALWCLYILRALNNPSMIITDIDKLDKAELAAQKIKLSKAQIVQALWKLFALAFALAAMYLAARFG